MEESANIKIMKTDVKEHLTCCLFIICVYLRVLLYVSDLQ